MPLDIKENVGILFILLLLGNSSFFLKESHKLREFLFFFWKGKLLENRYFNFVRGPDVFVKKKRLNLELAKISGLLFFPIFVNSFGEH